MSVILFIVYVNSKGVEIETAEFSTMSRCEIARTELENMELSGRVIAKCFNK